MDRSLQLDDDTYWLRIAPFVAFNCHEFSELYQQNTTKSKKEEGLSLSFFESISKFHA
jgi:hypothetical protein